MTLNDSLANAIVTAVLALSAALGSAINAYLLRCKKYRKDFQAATRKIRRIEDKLGLEYQEIESFNDLFGAIRRIKKKLGIESDLDDYESS